MLFNPWPEILHRARKERGLTQDNAADRAEVSEVTWNRWEKGRVYPGPKSFDSLARGVDLPVDELGFRYAQAQMRHYDHRPAPSPETGNPPDDALRAGDDRRARPAMIRAFSAQQGALWIDLQGLVEVLSEHRSAGPAIHPPDDSQPQAVPRGPRRNEP